MQKPAAEMQTRKNNHYVKGGRGNCTEWRYRKYMVPEAGVARISLGGFAIGLRGAAPGFRAP